MQFIRLVVLYQLYMFPSPCGVNIVANRTKLLLNWHLLFKQRFPSPCGVNIVANRFVVLNQSVENVVSVPLRGKYRGEWFLSFSASKPNKVRVSVPLRGKYRGESCLLLHAVLLYSLSVSVPLRGKYRGECCC